MTLRRPSRASRREGGRSPTGATPHNGQSMEIVGRETIYQNRNAVQTNPATSVSFPLVPIDG